MQPFRTRIRSRHSATMAHKEGRKMTRRRRISQGRKPASPWPMHLELGAEAQHDDVVVVVAARQVRVAMLEGIGGADEEVTGQVIGPPTRYRVIRVALRRRSALGIR